LKISLSAQAVQEKWLISLFFAERTTKFGKNGIKVFTPNLNEIKIL
jgi:hypothetical protein